MYSIPLPIIDKKPEKKYANVAFPKWEMPKRRVLLNKFFIANPNHCAQAYLKSRGIKCDKSHSDAGGVSYSGDWVSQKCARKLYQACVGNGDMPNAHTNDAFELFEASASGTIRIEPNRMMAILGLPNSVSKAKRMFNGALHGKDLAPA